MPDLYFVEDVENMLVSLICSTLETAQAGGPNLDCLRGELIMAKAVGLAVGIKWRDLMRDVKASVGGPDLADLLDRAARALPRSLSGVDAGGGNDVT